MISKPQNKILSNNQVEDVLPPDCLYTILGPTASGKTKLAVALAQTIAGEIISIDSRQVYRGMDIGTGKDLKEYQEIPYHLIDIIDPGERYDVSRFQHDFKEAHQQIIIRGKVPIAVGGTGLYMHSLFIHRPYIQVETDTVLRERLVSLDKTELIAKLNNYLIPDDLHIDISSHKRLIRGIEILEALKQGYKLNHTPMPQYRPVIFGINPSIEKRRNDISRRLKQRIDNGLVAEVQNLLSLGVTHEDLRYFGLEYKYASMHILGEMSVEEFSNKLETEIHRYAKRQMTFFRKMEKDGLVINWLKGDTIAQRLDEILTKLKKE